MKRNISSIIDLPSIGEKATLHLSKVGIKSFREIEDKDPYQLYIKLCIQEEDYYDPCVLDQFIAVSKFAKEGIVNNWWFYTEERKSKFSEVHEKIKFLKS